MDYLNRDAFVGSQLLLHCFVDTFLPYFLPVCHGISSLITLGFFSTFPAVGWPTFDDFFTGSKREDCGFGSKQ
ncbi:hypothetical protein M513_01815 [Trichuris suis]|uniref:Uncharacterized protein n=1 Tax=Trichuris suis TaxID=68888 RepID=A0A085MJA8_9BILA|nr:hypothetical protein M513_01815 [Trichuris suis]